MPKPIFDPATWGTREDGTSKGNGFFGVLARPDGGVSTEISMGTSDVDGTEQQIPLLVPTLTPEEVQYLVSNPPNSDWSNPVMQSIAQKAIEFAKTRKSAGQPFFAGNGEQQSGLVPNLPRAVPLGADVMATSRRSSDPSLLADFLLRGGK